MKIAQQFTVLVACLCAFLNVSSAPACTGITITPKDGSLIFGCTLEFATDLKSNVIVVPRGKQYIGSTPTGEPGLRWKTKYGVIGLNAFNMPVTLDGLNEKGLHVGLFYFPGFAKYQAIRSDEIKQTLAPWELGVFLLGTCSTANEAVAAANSVRVSTIIGDCSPNAIQPVHPRPPTSHRLTAGIRFLTSRTISSIWYGCNKVGSFSSLTRQAIKTLCLRDFGGSCLISSTI